MAARARTSSHIRATGVRKCADLVTAGGASRPTTHARARPQPGHGSTTSPRGRRAAGAEGEGVPRAAAPPQRRTTHHREAERHRRERVRHHYGVRVVEHEVVRVGEPAYGARARRPRRPCAAPVRRSRVPARCGPARRRSRPAALVVDRHVWRSGRQAHGLHAPRGLWVQTGEHQGQPREVERRPPGGVIPPTMSVTMPSPSAATGCAWLSISPTKPPSPELVDPQPGVGLDGGTDAVDGEVGAPGVGADLQHQVARTGVEAGSDLPVELVPMPSLT